MRTVESSFVVKAVLNFSISRLKSFSVPGSIGDSLSYWSIQRAKNMRRGRDISAFGDFFRVERFAVESCEVSEEDCVARRGTVEGDEVFVGCGQGERTEGGQWHGHF